MKKRLGTLLLSISLLTPSLWANDHPFQISDDLDQAIKQGLSELYNFNFEKSLAIFDSIQGYDGEHPMVAFGVASTHWWRISAMVLEADPKESKPFLDAVDRCIKVSEAKIKAGDSTGEGHLVLGGALGLLGRWQATNHQWLSAYRSGKKAYKYLSKALEINPKMIDANMGHGIFDYYVATLPAVVRVLAFVGMGGDPSVGIKELSDAAYNGTYAKTPSKLFLMQIYNDQEKSPDKAIKIMEELRQEYPRSPFMHMMHIITLYNDQRMDQLKEEAESFEKRVRTKVYPNDFLGQACFSQGLTHFKAKEWKEASEDFLRAFKSADSIDPWKTWAALYAGFCEDALGNRPNAIAQYKWVLSNLRRWGSHDHAKWRLKTPFKGTPEELEKLAL